MNAVGLIVARNGSTRVPAKALLAIEGRPVLWHVIRIARQVRGLATVGLATTTLARDDSLAHIAEEQGIQVHRGDPENVLDRIYAAAEAARADTVVYIGGDCPLLDPDVVSTALEEFARLGCDYLSNYDPPTFPGGLDVNIVAVTALRTAFEKALAPSQRVHPFSYLTFHPDDFAIRNFAHDEDRSTLHWSIDDPGDIDFVRSVYASLYRLGGSIGMADVLALIARDERIAQANRQLLKPHVRHAFFASPGMMNDITNDILTLSTTARELLIRGDIAGAERHYREVYFITKKLGNQ